MKFRFLWYLPCFLATESLYAQVFPSSWVFGGGILAFYGIKTLKEKRKKRKNYQDTIKILDQAMDDNVNEDIDIIQKSLLFSSKKEKDILFSLYRHQ